MYSRNLGQVLVSRRRNLLIFRGVIMLRGKKEQVINELTDRLSRCTSAIATDYRGLSAKEMVQLRQRLIEVGVEFRVTKNTLVRFAAERANKEQLETFLTGPLAIAFGYDDETKPARALSEHIRSAGSVLQIRGGILGDRLLTIEEVSALAFAPPREILLAQIMGQMQAPLQTLHNILSSPLQGFLNILQARIQQVEGG